MGKPTGFLEYTRREDGRRPAAERVRDWEEFHLPLPEEIRRQQGARCMNCGVPFCQAGMIYEGKAFGCPLHNLIPEWNDMILSGNWGHALSRLLKANSFPEFTGRVCPAPCENACICGIYGDPITVRDNELSIIEAAFGAGKLRPRRPPQWSGKKVCVVGSGPAGLAAADQLNRRGHMVTVIERAEHPGGLLMYGIPNMKLPKSVVRRRIDLKYAREAAEFIGADHTEVYMTRKEVLAALPVVIAALGTWDITTIRASMGMYLCCKAIHEKTDIRVLLTGEISDELFGYKYTDFAPSAGAFQQESKKRVDELHMYDVLRADRCISVNSLEARVPFGDLDFVKYVMAVDPALKMNTSGMGKYLLRHAFEKDRLLPDSILWRQKAAFSDAVGHSMVDDLKAYAEEKYTDSEFETRRKQYDYCPPFTKESLLYREIFEQCYPGQARMIRDFWMPNRSWEGCDVDDPSARVLSNYGQSGM